MNKPIFLVSIAIIVVCAVLIFSTGDDPAPVSPSIEALDKQPSTAVKPAAAPTAQRYSSDDHWSQAPQKPDTASDPSQEIENFEDTQAMFDALGIEEQMAKSLEWRHARGFVRVDESGTPMLDQPYDQYDDETLTAFADEGDMWAQQELASRLERDRPVDAATWYRKAAENGSLFAMQKISQLYARSNEVAREFPIPGLDADDQSSMMRHVWRVAAQLAGADPTQNISLNSQLEQQYEAEQYQQLCEAAVNLYSTLNNAQGGFDRTAPPLLSGSIESLKASLPCADIGLISPDQAGPDYSFCTEKRLGFGGDIHTTITCN